MPSARCVAALVRLGFEVVMAGKVLTTLRRADAVTAIPRDVLIDDDALDTICVAAGVLRTDLDDAATPLRLVGAPP
jgi:hypothetical protein